MNYIRYPPWGRADNTNQQDPQLQEVDNDISSSPTLSPIMSTPPFASQGKYVHDATSFTTKTFDNPIVIDAQDDLNKLLEDSNNALRQQKARIKEAHVQGSSNINSKLQNFNDGLTQELQKMLQAINQEAEVSFLERKEKIEESFQTQLQEER